MGTQVVIPTTSTNDGKTTSSVLIQRHRDKHRLQRHGETRRSVPCERDGGRLVGVPRGQKTTPNITGLPVVRSFQTTNRLILKDGQTSQFTAATDRVSGEVVRIDITLKVVK